MKNGILVVLAAASILLLPLLAMQFTEEVRWDLFDFGVAGALLVGTGLTFVILTRKMRNAGRRATIGIAFAAVLIFIWLELAVGIIGTPLSGQ
ncbi:MAG: hypothetical protein H7335_09405 [Massilia sp.]|nr:hypothetical protein [Massilia sp.]